MSHKHQYQLTVSGEWVKYLRRYGRRAFWKAERKAYRALADKEVTALPREGQLVYDCETMPTKVQDLITCLRADGWTLMRQKGIHQQFHHPTKIGTVTVAGRPSIEIPPGTLNSILKQAGLKK